MDTRRLFTVILIFAIALIPRLVDLDSHYITVDEPLWVNRSSDYVNALLSLDFRECFSSLHPGVTVSFLSGVSILLFGSIIGDFFAARLPCVLIGSLLPCLVFLFVGRVFGFKTGLLSALLVALDPLLIGHSRVVHLDVTLTFFCTLSVLSFYEGIENRRYLIISGIAMGLAFLTKVVGVFVPVVLFLWYFFVHRDLDGGKTSRKDMFKTFGLFLLVSSLTVFVLWPKMWVDPLILYDMFKSHVYSSEPFLGSVFGAKDGIFFLGGTHYSLPLLYYPLVVICRVNPLIVLVSVVFLFYLFTRIKGAGLSYVSLLLLWTILFVTLMSVGGKKFDRYILPVFPMFSVLASVGVLYLPKRYFNIIAVVLVLSQLFFVYQIHPYYFKYYSPIIGGTTGAANIFQIEWGEGLEEAAEYLNKKPSTTVAAWYNRCFKVYYKGEIISFWGIDDAEINRTEYFVFYINQIQRGYNGELWARYKYAEPEYVVNVRGLDVVYVYRNRDFGSLYNASSQHL